MDKLEIKIKILELLIYAEKNDFVLSVGKFENEIGAARKDIRKILKELIVLNMVEVVTRWNEDGLLNGRGYVLTTRATQFSVREWLKVLKDLSLDIAP